MKRRRFNLRWLLPCAAVLAAWAWSYDTWRAGVSSGQVVVVLTDGGDSAGRYMRAGRRENWDAASMFSGLRSQAARSAALAGFEYHRGRTLAGFRFSYTLLAAPMWALLVLSLVPPGVVLWLARRRRVREQTGRCARCGYDLRATPGRCPECGEAQVPGETAGPVGAER